MSYLLPHLTSGWAVDQAILSEETRLVCIRFGHDYDPVCMQMDEVLYSVAEKVKNWRAAGPQVSHAGERQPRHLSLPTVQEAPSFHVHSRPPRRHLSPFPLPGA